MSAHSYCTALSAFQNRGIYTSPKMAATTAWRVERPSWNLVSIFTFMSAGGESDSESESEGGVWQWRREKGGEQRRDDVILVYAADRCIKIARCKDGTGAGWLSLYQSPSNCQTLLLSSSFIASFEFVELSRFFNVAGGC